MFSRSNNLSFISILRSVSSSSCDSEDGICVETLQHSEAQSMQQNMKGSKSLKAGFQCPI